MTRRCGGEVAAAFEACQDHEIGRGGAMPQDWMGNRTSPAQGTVDAVPTAPGQPLSPRRPG